MRSGPKVPPCQWNGPRSDLMFADAVRQAGPQSGYDAPSKLSSSGVGSRRLCDTECLHPELLDEVMCAIVCTGIAHSCSRHFRNLVPPDADPRDSSRPPPTAYRRAQGSPSDPSLGSTLNSISGQSRDMRTGVVLLLRCPTGFIACTWRAQMTRDVRSLLQYHKAQ